MIPLGGADSTARTSPDAPPLRVEEHKDIQLPAAMLLSDGSVDIYDEVQALLQIKYSRKLKAFTVRSEGWIGQIPLNDWTSLRVETKTPVANLERIIDRATFPARSIETLKRHRRSYGATPETPSSLMDVLTDSFLTALDMLKAEGLLKSYAEAAKTDAAPAGRLDALRSAIRTATAGRPLARSTRFERTVDNPPNRVVSLALDTLIRRHAPHASPRSSRATALLDVRGWFPKLPSPPAEDRSSAGVDRLVRRLPRYHQGYGPALRLASQLVANLGPRLLFHENFADAAVALVKLDQIFEGYCRNVLLRLDNGRRRILDGNVEGDGGAKRPLYSEVVVPQASRPTAEPDIVIMEEGAVRLLIDVKYRIPDAAPDRDIVNQLTCYAARYGCDRVMSLHPARPKNRLADVELVGSIGAIRIYRGTLDVSREDLEQAEAELCSAIDALLNDNGGTSANQRTVVVGEPDS